jgi:hypothetical protein
MAGLSGFFILHDSLTPLLASVDVKEEAREIMEDIAKEVEGYAKQNAPWTDRTGAARQGLTAEVSEHGDDIVLELYHTVDYGVWLETIQAGAYAIIMPTLEYFSRETMDRLHATETGFDGGESG